MIKFKILFKYLLNSLFDTSPNELSSLGPGDAHNVFSRRAFAVLSPPSLDPHLPALPLDVCVLLAHFESHPLW